MRSVGYAVISNYVEGGCGFFKRMCAGSISAGFGDQIDSYCAIKMALLSYVSDSNLAEIILRSYGHLNNNTRLPGLSIDSNSIRGCPFAKMTSQRVRA